MEKRTLETVLRDIGEMVENRIPVGPEQWLQSAQFLNLFLEEETNKLYDLQSRIAKLRAQLLPTAKSVAALKVTIEATDDWCEMKKQEAKIKQVEEYIRISKLQARMANEQIRGN